MMFWGGGWMLGVGVIGFVLVCFLVMMVLRFTVWGYWNHRMGCGRGRMSGSMDAEEILKQCVDKTIEMRARMINYATAIKRRSREDSGGVPRLTGVLLLRQRRIPDSGLRS